MRNPKPSWTDYFVALELNVDAVLVANINIINLNGKTGDSNAIKN